MIKVKKITTLLISVILIVVLLSGEMSYITDVVFAEPVEAETIETEVIEADILKIPPDYKKAGESASFILYYNDDPSIIIEDKRNGYLWTSSVAEEDEAKLGTINEVWRNTMKSIFSLKYANISKRGEHKIITTPSYGKNTKVKINSINNGIRLDYIFTNFKFGVSIEIFIDNDELCVRIPENSIQEYGDFAIVSIEILPFFGYADDETDGYILCPDGSGAIYVFTDRINKSATNRLHRWYIYGNEKNEIIDYEKMKREEAQQAFLPVFGTKKGENAYIAFIENGEHYCAINLSPSGYAVMLNRISAEFSIRIPFSLPSAEVSAQEKITQEKMYITKVPSEKINVDRCIRYAFLHGDESDYSGMANYYRKHLLENNKIKRVIKQGDKLPLSLSLFMGIIEEGLLFDKFIKTTTFDKAKTIINELNEEGIDNMILNLIGWENKGYGAYPTSTPPARQLGGWTGLRELAELTAEKGYDMYLQVNLIDMLRENVGFFYRRDAARNYLNIIIANEDKSHYFMNPFIAVKKFENLMSEISRRSVDISGYTLEKSGYVIYEDHHGKYPSSRGKTAEYWNDALKKSIESTGKVAAHGGNLYVLDSADMLYSIPFNVSGYYLVYKTVPFYQSVVHGCIHYACDQPVNLFYDHTLQKLKLIEYGYLPHFELTYEQPNLIIHTGYNRLFSSCYDNWKEEVLDIYNEFSNKLGNTYSAFIINHSNPQEGVFKTEYDNGYTVLVNYNDYPVFVDGHEIKAMDYLVLDKGGNVR